MGLFKKTDSHEDKLKYAYRCYKPELVGTVFPGGIEQMSAIIHSIALLCDIDLMKCYCQQYHDITSIYTDIHIRKNLTKTPDDRIVVTLLVKHGNIVKNEEIARLIVEYYNFSQNYRNANLNDDNTWNLFEKKTIVGQKASVEELVDDIMAPMYESAKKIGKLFGESEEEVINKINKNEPIAKIENNKVMTKLFEAVVNCDDLIAGMSPLFRKKASPIEALLLAYLYDFVEELGFKKDNQKIEILESIKNDYKSYINEIDATRDIQQLEIYFMQIFPQVHGATDDSMVELKKMSYSVTRIDAIISGCFGSSCGSELLNVFTDSNLGITVGGYIQEMFNKCGIILMPMLNDTGVSQLKDSVIYGKTTPKEDKSNGEVKQNTNPDAPNTSLTSSEKKLNEDADTDIPVELLTQLKQLHDAGVLTDEECTEKKRKVLGI